MCLQKVSPLDQESIVCYKVFTKIKENLYSPYQYSNVGTSSYPDLVSYELGVTYDAQNSKFIKTLSDYLPAFHAFQSLKDAEFERDDWNGRGEIICRVELSKKLVSGDMYVRFPSVANVVRHQVHGFELKCFAGKQMKILGILS